MLSKFLGIKSKDKINSKNENKIVQNKNEIKNENKNEHKNKIETIENKNEIEYEIKIENEIVENKNEFKNDKINFTSFRDINMKDAQIKMKIIEIKKFIEKFYPNKNTRTKRFIKESILVYGYSVFDYSNVFCEDKGDANKKSIDFICKRFGHKKIRRIFEHLYMPKDCKVCENHDKWIRESKEIHKDKNGNQLYIYDTTIYIHSHKRVNIFCIACNEYFSQTPTNHKDKKRGCEQCAIKRRTMTREMFINLSQQIHIDLDGYILYDYSKVIYENQRKNVEIICLTCKNSFFPTPDSHLHKQSGCPNCSSFKTEKLVRQLLFMLTGLKFIKKSRFLKCIEYPVGLELDCYNEELELDVEVNGIQHEEKNRRYHKTDEDFENQIKRDKVKEKECENKGIKLIIVPSQYNYQNVKKLYNYLYEQLETNGIFDLLEKKGIIIRYNNGFRKKDKEDEKKEKLIKKKKVEKKVKSNKIEKKEESNEIEKKVDTNKIEKKVDTKLNKDEQKYKTVIIKCAKDEKKTELAKFDSVEDARWSVPNCKPSRIEIAIRKGTICLGFYWKQLKIKC